MAWFKALRESKSIVNVYECQECKKQFMYENIDYTPLINIKFCPLCGTNIDGISE